MKETSQGIVLNVSIKTNMPAFIIHERGGLFLIELTEQPHGNKANLEIISELGRIFRCEVKILKGLKSRKKTILLNNIAAEEFNSRIKSLD